MALAVESYSSASSTDETVSITKPSGVAAGDLLLLIGTNADSNEFSCTGFTTSWSEYYNAPGALGDVGVQVSYRIADSSDEAASNYSVVFQSTSEGAACAMLRISGWSSGDPIYAGAKLGFYNSTGGTASISGLSLGRLSQQVAIMAMGSFDGVDSDYYGTLSNRTLTSSDSNPTWTEVCNILGVGNNITGISAKSLNVAYATTSLSSTVTGYSFDYLEYDGDTKAGGYGLLILLEAAADDSDSNSLVTTDGTIFTASGTSDASAGNTLLSATTTTPSQSGQGKQPTQWTNEAVVNTTWTNEDAL